MEAWRAYQRAFHDFSEQVRDLQALTTDPHPNRSAIEAALLEVEKARLVYDRCRDAMARHFMPSPRRAAVQSVDSREAVYERVRTLAELLWESSGRPSGTADEDWRQAEEIVRRAATAA
jgi:hypothetical protein